MKFYKSIANGFIIYFYEAKYTINETCICDDYLIVKNIKLINIPYFNKF